VPLSAVKRSGLSRLKDGEKMSDAIENDPQNGKDLGREAHADRARSVGGTVMQLRPYLKGDTRRVWRNYRMGGAAFLLAIVLVTALVWIIA
jgi:hypothetical protein